MILVQTCVCAVASFDLYVFVFSLIDMVFAGLVSVTAVRFFVTKVDYF